MNALRTCGLSVQRGGKGVLSDVSIRVEPGRTTALLGPNGAGKSTLVAAIAGVLPVAAGRITLGARSLNGMTPEAIRALGVSALFEGHRVLGQLSVEENLRTAGCRLDGASLRDAMQSAYGVFPELAERRAQSAGSLSGGEQQMLALAQALMAKPAFVLADEMSLGLAPLVVKRLMQVLAGFTRQGCGVLLIEQFTHVALRLADHVYVLHRGRVAFDGGPGEVALKPSILHDAYFATRSAHQTQAT